MAASEVADTRQEIGQVDRKSLAVHIEDHHDAAEKGHTATNRYGRSLVRFDPKVEAKLLFKIDLFVVPSAALIGGMSFLDRSNIGNARLAGLEKDLGMKGNDFNIALTLFWVAYIVFEMPSLVACKYFGPGRFLPAMILGFGTACLATGFANNMAQVCGLRILLGFFEAPVLGGIAYYYSRWYTRDELTFRLGICSVMGPLMGAFSGLAASAILTLDHFGSMTRWRMILGIEGVITLGIGVITFFTFTDRPETARWLTPEEKVLAVARLKAERVATTEVLDTMDKPKLLRGILNPAVLTTAVIFCLSNITSQGVSFFLPTVIQAIYPHKPVVTQQLWTVPPYVLGVAGDIIIPFLSWKFQRRLIFIVILLPMVIIGYIMFLATTDPHVRYAGVFLICFAIIPTSVICQAQVAANVVSDTARSSALAINVLIGNFGGLVSTWAFLPFDAPNYPIGNGLNLASATCTLFLALSLIFWMLWDNKRRETRDVDAELDGLSMKQIHDLDWTHPAFRWKP